jgi:carboxyl-terminal processing protease
MRQIKQVFLFLALLLICFALGFTWRDVQSGQAPSLRAVNLLFGVRTDSKASPQDVFKQTYNRILTQYAEQVKAKELKYAGMEGLMASLGDPHTMFLAPVEAKEFSEQTRANFFGIGARLQPDPAGAEVVTVFPDGPAFAAGLRDGSIITRVDGQSVAGKDINDIVDSIKGKEGTTVNLGLILPDKSKPMTLTIKRARVTAPTVEGKYLPDSQMGYLSISQFSEPTPKQFDDQLQLLEQHPLKGLVIDLRGNPGGLLSTAQDMLSRFVEDKVVVRMRFRNGEEEVEKTYPGSKHDFEYPIVCLINEDSASAAEIFAGCLRDYGKATLIGEHSYGKASVQNVFPLVDDASAKITIAKYFLPDKEFIGRKVDSDGVYISGGLDPTVHVALNLDQTVTIGDPKTDNQLARAIKFLQDKS